MKPKVKKSAVPPEAPQTEEAVKPKAETTAVSRRGFEKFTHNPFLSEVSGNTKIGVKRITNKDGNRMLVVSENTGEIIAPAGFWHAQEVDKTQFIKLYINGVKAFKNLTGAGTRVFEVLYLRMQEAIGKDVVWISLSEIDQSLTPMSKATFSKGMTELIEKGFIAESVTQSKYYLNPDYLFNGNRLAFVKEYRKAPDAESTEQTTQPLLAAFSEAEIDATPH